MLFDVLEIRKWETAYQGRDGYWYPARPVWSTLGRWRHAWWVLTGKCDAIYWPENGNPYFANQNPPCSASRDPTRANDG
jgi:hypothetical protein